MFRKFLGARIENETHVSEAKIENNSEDCPLPPPPPRTQPTHYNISFATHARINEIKIRVKSKK